MNLTIEHLSKQYRRDFWGLREFDLELGPGVVGLLGPVNKFAVLDYPTTYWQLYLPLSLLLVLLAVIGRRRQLL